MSAASVHASEWAGDEDVFSDPAERRLILSVLDSFSQYRRAAHLNATHLRRQNFYALPSRHWTLLSKPPFSLLDTFNRVDDAIDANADLAEAILNCGIASFGLHKDHAGGNSPIWKGCATKHNLDKARSTIHQIYRDWSAEGLSERSACFDPLFGDLYEKFSEDDILNGNGVNVLIPGAGLGRLVFELCRAGFHAEGNEISYHQLFASSLMLNSTIKANEWTLYPFALSFSNQLSRENQLRKVMVPDVHPGSTPLPGSMSMTTGDFCTVYRTDEYEGCFDAVVTLFFIDTAPNLVKYIETVKHCLRSGGMWANVGPLLWHAEVEPTSSNEVSEAKLEKTEESDESSMVDKGIGEAGSVELTQEEVKMLLEHHGFIFTKHEVNHIETGYMQDPRSMLQYTYRPVHWVALKS